MTRALKSPTDKKARAVGKLEDPKRQNRLCPSLYQVNTRVLLHELGVVMGRPATLDDVPETLLDTWAAQGFDWIWFLGVWQTGLIGQRISQQQPEWQKEFRELLPDFDVKDVCGSCFSIKKYEVHTDFGGNAALARLRDRLRKRGLKLLLDFVPNHTALDHEWVQSHPEFYVRGTEALLEREPKNYVRLEVRGAPIVFAYGRDPYFDGWPDTLQLNYGEPRLQEAMQAELKKISDQCDGVRCDMAMLILPEVFQKTWGVSCKPFWPATIDYIRSMWPDFLFMAEVYWDLEWTLQQHGFSYTYDKRLYDRLREGNARSVREHFFADMPYQLKSARFLENHDEPRAAATFDPQQHRAAAILTFLCPGLRFFHDGQFDGRHKKVPVHLRRRPEEKPDGSLHEFYSHLLACVNLPSATDGDWRLLTSEPAWQDNWTSDCLIVVEWGKTGEDRLLIAVNYSNHQSQCYVRFRPSTVDAPVVRLVDLMGPAVYDRDVAEIQSRGLYLDLPAWGYHVFRVTKPE